MSMPGLSQQRALALLAPTPASYSHHFTRALPPTYRPLTYRPPNRTSGGNSGNSNDNHDGGSGALRPRACRDVFLSPITHTVPPRHGTTPPYQPNYASPVRC